ncbi:MAG: TonB-dependent receptor [Rhizobacter sp.]
MRVSRKPGMLRGLRVFRLPMPTCLPAFRATFPIPHAFALLALAAAACAAQAQTATPAAPAASAPAAPTAAPAPQQLEKVEIIQQRNNDLRERRQSTAAKIVIGREEIERFGDSTIGETLKRLPGVTMQGSPGRGGAIRMRGLGSGYTLILIDGQRVPPGFSIESLEPDQVERIEVLRAPTAETGARAIAGVINIVMREGFRKTLNNLRVGLGLEDGHVQPNFSWTRNDTAGDWIYNYSLNAFRQDRDTNTVFTRERVDLGTGTVVESQRDTGWARDQRNGLHANGRLQWRGTDGMSAVLQPMLIYSEGKSERRNQLEQFAGTAPYDHSDSSGSGAFSLARLNGEWRQSLSESGRLELKTGLAQSRFKSDSMRYERAADESVLHTRRDHSDNEDTTVHLNGKYSALLVNDHSLVSGLEVESNRRVDAGRTLYDGAPLLTDSGDNLAARTLRLAAYTQDEWTISPNWSAHAGLRWEGVRVTSDEFDSGGGLTDVSNRSSVWSPLLHAVWKPDPKGNDQVRLSLTRTYRSPTLQNLIARPSVSGRSPLTDEFGNPQSNTPTTPDRAGNPDLKPELATGLDLAFEHYLGGGGLLSANVFYRRISNYMRSVTTLETVGYSPGAQRYVSRTRNIGNADTQGIELEARFRLSDAIPTAPKVDMRLNASIFHSRVKPVPGPDNRLDQQPDGTANIGADYKIPGLPLSLGGNLNWTPGYSTRVTELQWAEQGKKLVGDAFVVWTLNPTTQLRVSASNFVPRDYVTGGRFEDASARDTSETVESTRVNWQLRLEMRL